MARMTVSEDSANGTMMLKPSSSRHVDVAAVLFGGMLTCAGLTLALGTEIVVLGLIFVTAASLHLFFLTGTISLDPATRLMKKTIGIGRFERYTLLPFTQIANIDVDLHLVYSKGESPSHSWRLRAIDRAGNEIELNSMGKRDEMIELGKKIAALTGAPLLDRKYSSALDQQAGG